MKTALWRQALRTVPHVTREEWGKLNVISRWLVATRSGVLIMTAISAITGGLLAYSDDFFDVLNFTAAFFGLVLAHASYNMINDWMVHRRLEEKEDHSGIRHGHYILEKKYLKPWRFLVTVFFTMALSASALAYLVLYGPATVFYLVMAGLFSMLFFYRPLKHIGLGEPAAIFLWGPLMIGGTYYVTSGYHWSPVIIWISVIYAIGPAAVLFGKHIDKMKEDRKKKFFTLPVIIGEELSRFIMMDLWAVQYIGFTFLVIFAQLKWPVLLIFLALPQLVKKGKAFLKKRPETKPDDYEAEAWPLYFARYAFEYNKVFSLLFLLGMIVHVLLIKLS